MLKATIIVALLAANPAQASPTTAEILSHRNSPGVRLYLQGFLDALELGEIVAPLGGPQQVVIFLTSNNGMACVPSEIRPTRLIPSDLIRAIDSLPSKPQNSTDAIADGLMRSYPCAASVHKDLRDWMIKNPTYP